LGAEIGILTKKCRTGGNSSYDKKIHKSAHGFVEYAPHSRHGTLANSAFAGVRGETFHPSLKIDLSSELLLPNEETKNKWAW
jgi:hypothetical protein